MTRKKCFILIFFIILIFPFILKGAKADETKINNENEQNENIYRGSFLKFSNEEIVIDQVIDGDVIVIAESLKITNNVKGDVLALAENIEINGEIEGDVRIAGKNIIINSAINKNVNIFSLNTEINQNSKIGKSILIASRTLKVKGLIKGDMDASAEFIEFGGNIEGNIKADLGEQGNLIITPESKIKGSLNYYSAKEFEIPKSAVISGEIKHSLPSNNNQKGNIWLMLLGKLISLLSMTLIGIAALSIDKKNTMKAVNEIILKPSKSALYGIGYFFLIPIISFILFFTIIGFPLALITVVVYLILLYISQIFSAIAIGTVIMRKLKNVNEKSAMILGIIIFVILASIPVIGFYFKMMAIFFGIGTIINTKREILKETNI